MMMKNRWIRCMATVMVMLLLAGCGNGSGNSDVPQITKEVADAMEESADTGEDTDSGAEPLGEENEIPEDGIITAAQMETIAGKEGSYHFNGESEDGIIYQWAYDGSKIKNPQDQALKVTFTTDKLEDVKKAANNAPYGIGLTIQEMYMAAPATLSVKLPEKWDADKVLLCVYKDEKLYQVTEGKIKQGKKKTKITFDVTEVGDTFYLVAGATGASSADASTEGGTASGGNNSTGDNQQTTAATGDGSSTVDSSGSDSTGNDSSRTGTSDNTGGGTSETGGSVDVNGGDTTTALKCTISIDCITILSNMGDLKSGKEEFVPSDGYILYPSEVEFTQGETVFDVLKRVCGNTGIQMESSWTPLYNSYYIEGINNLYEFDCGANSGWMYNVNGWYPNYGCSSYTLENGDNIQWRYTCNYSDGVGDSMGE